MLQRCQLADPFCQRLRDSMGSAADGPVARSAFSPAFSTPVPCSFHRDLTAQTGHCDRPPPAIIHVPPTAFRTLRRLLDLLKTVLQYDPSDALFQFLDLLLNFYSASRNDLLNHSTFPIIDLDDNLDVHNALPGNHGLRALGWFTHQGGYLMR